VDECLEELVENASPVPIVIFGPGGLGHEVLTIILAQNKVAPTWDLQGFLIDPEYSAPAEIHGFPVLGGLDWLKSRPEVKVVIGVGAPADRRRIAERISRECGNRFATIIHPRAWLGEEVTYGEGVVIHAGALISIDITIGDHAVLNLGSIVGHNTVIEPYSVISPGAHLSGHVHIEEGVDLGSGAVVLQEIRIGRGTVVGAGSCVTKDLPQDCVAVGVPAKPIKTRVPGWDDQNK
jgi:sugar O-acyltransferase (sialic acid O-acetyltransferase NeuD family)